VGVVVGGAGTVLGAFGVYAGVSGSLVPVLGKSSGTPRKISWKSSQLDPKWGLTKKHLEKHFFGDGELALRQIDPGGTPDKWVRHLTDLASSPVTSTTSNGMIDIIKTFPKADGSGTFKLGIRLAPKPDGTFDLITVLTRQ
jgi:hypothetical protein